MLSAHRIARAAAAFCVAAVAGTAAAAEGVLEPLMTPGDVAAVAAQESDLLILDIRAPDGERSYAAGHLPGAVSAPYPLWRGPAENPGEPLTEARATALFQALGVTLDRPTVVLHDGAGATEFGAAARVYWTLKSAGVGDLAIVNGGQQAWEAAGLPISTEPTAPTPSDIVVAFSDAYTASREDVAAIVDGAADGVLLDARPDAFLTGERAHPAAAAAGTLPGAENIVQDTWFDGGAFATDAEGVAAVLAASGAQSTPGEGVVSFCNTGHWAATNWFALSEVGGVEDVRLYPGSMVDWTAAGGDVETR